MIPVHNMPAVFFSENRLKLSVLLKDKALLAMVSNDIYPRSGDQSFPFRQDTDIYYLSGIIQQGVRLLMCPSHPDPTKQEILFIQKPDPLHEIWYGKQLNAPQAANISGIKTVLYIEDFDRVFHELAMWTECIYLGTTEYAKVIPNDLMAGYRFAREITKKYPLQHFERTGPLLSQLRLIKQAEEIKEVTKACQITAAAFESVLKILKPGIFEYEIEAEIISNFMRKSALPAYDTIVGSGINACCLHYINNQKKCEEGELILMDFGAEVSGYASDCSRTVPVNGRFSKRQREVYNAVLTVHKELITLCKPGITINQLNETAGFLIDDELLQFGLIKTRDLNDTDSRKKARSKYFMHGVCHFIGLDVHDTGDKDIAFKAGMIITIEPGIYIQEEAMGIRIENDILITADGCTDLMLHIPREVEEIEERMNRTEK